MWRVDDISTPVYVFYYRICKWDMSVISFRMCLFSSTIPLCFSFIQPWFLTLLSWILNWLPARQFIWSNRAEWKTRCVCIDVDQSEWNDSTKLTYEIFNQMSSLVLKRKEENLGSRLNESIEVKINDDSVFTIQGVPQKSLLVSNS